MNAYDGPPEGFGTWLAEQNRAKQEELAALGSDLRGHQAVSDVLRRGQVGLDQGVSRQTRAAIVSDVLPKLPRGATRADTTMTRFLKDNLPAGEDGLSPWQQRTRDARQGRWGN